MYDVRCTIYDKKLNLIAGSFYTFIRSMWSVIIHSNDFKNHFMHSCNCIAHCYIVLDHFDNLCRRYIGKGHSWIFPVENFKYIFMTLDNS